MDRFYIGEYIMPDGTKPVEVKFKTPIEWILLEEKGEECLLYSKDCLDWELYSDDDISWKNTYMCYLLNDMYNSCFNQDEKDAIVEKDDGPLFLLSKEELLKYFPEKDDRRAILHFIYLKADKEIDDSIEHQCYWLRADDECDPEELPVVTSLGEFDTMYGGADEIGVRPAMWINKKKARELTGKMGFNRWHHWWNPDEF